MRLDIRTIITAVALGAIPLTAGCGGKDKAGGNIQMKDMEVVDGTASDAMTDLDGVKGEVAGTAPSPTADNAGSATNAAETKAPLKDARPQVDAGSDSGSDAEVLADQ